MRSIEQWIWFPKSLYPNHQTSEYCMLAPQSPGLYSYAVAALTRTYRLNRAVKEIHLRFSGDTFFTLFCNHTHLASGPASAGGDFLEGHFDRPLPNYYATEMTLTAADLPGLADGVLDFYAQVRMTPARLFDQSKGHGGFFLTAFVRFADDTEAVLLTDETWQIQRLTAYTAPGQFDNSQPEEAPVSAERITNIWNCETAPIPPCVEKALVLSDGILIEPAEGTHPGLPSDGYPVSSETGVTLRIPARSSLTTTVSFDRIYAGYLSADAKFDCTCIPSGKMTVDIFCRELAENGSAEHYCFGKNDSCRSLEMHSAGNLLLSVTNDADCDALLHIDYTNSYYPIYTDASTRTSDADLNLVLDVCKHTLKQCRQTIHLDSPRHCEPLACTGDYYIESLMTAFTFGDQNLSAFDIRRTAELLRNRDGRMFHTTYSLIWVQMLWDVYRFTGDITLLADCEDALLLLLNRFSSYIGANGIIETPPDYMFIDWLIPDGINLHHPPKALGQTCLNMFYFGALKTAALIFDELGETAMAQCQRSRLNALTPAIESCLYDNDRQLFFEGLNTPTPEELLYYYMPANVEKRYYRKHANILAAYFGFFDKERCRDLLIRIMNDDALGEVQPYFTHFLLEAIYRNGLRDTYTLPILQQWKAPTKECPKGLVEGFHKPVEGYGFDHSHAWGGTPAYSLPLALSGLTIIEPGFRKISLQPSLLGLSHANVQIPTPYGMIELSLKDGQEPVITIPDGILLETAINITKKRSLLHVPISP